MKNIFKIFLGIALALNSTSCEDEKKDTWLNSMVPYNMIIGIFDEDGNNLLSESAEGNWLGLGVLPASAGVAMGKYRPHYRS